MGKAHSNAWRQVGRFFDTPFEPVMKVICGRNEQAVKRAAHDYGWEEYSTSWEEVVDRKDIDVIDICTPGDSHMPIAIAAAEAKGLTVSRAVLRRKLVHGGCTVRLTFLQHG